jgi:hypothetical protein
MRGEENISFKNISKGLTIYLSQQNSSIFYFFYEKELKYLLLLLALNSYFFWLENKRKNKATKKLLPNKNYTPEHKRGEA